MAGFRERVGFRERTVHKEGTKQFPYRSCVNVTKGTFKGKQGRIVGKDKRGPVTTGMLVSFGRNRVAVVGQTELKRCAPPKKKTTRATATRTTKKRRTTRRRTTRR